MQSTANAILGRLSIDFSITGPLIALSPLGDLAERPAGHRGRAAGGRGGGPVVLVGVELAGSERTAAAHRELGTEPAGRRPRRGDRARPEAMWFPPAGPRRTPSVDASSTRYGSLRGLVEAAARIRGATT
jgi:hypothetical protein